MSALEESNSGGNSDILCKHAVHICTLCQKPNRWYIGSAFKRLYPLIENEGHETINFPESENVIHTQQVTEVWEKTNTDLSDLGNWEYTDLCPELYIV